MGPKLYKFAATQAALVSVVFTLPGKHTKKGAGTRPDHSAFRLNPLAL